MKPLCTAALQRLRWLAPAAACTALAAAEGPGAQGLALSADGSTVVDHGKKQLWPRCAEGMRWNGNTCIGEAVRMSHAEAVAWAAALAQAEGVRWRLPHVTELRLLAAKTARPPAPGGDWFPAAPAGWYWSATASLDTGRVNQYDYANIARGRTNENAARVDPRHRWAVDPATGVSRGDIGRTTRLPVRLVRPQP